MLRCFVFLIITAFFSFPSFAEKIDYRSLFEVDLDEEFPSMEELEKRYEEKHVVYDWKYDYHWNIGNVFDQAFKVSIASYGGSDKRIKHESEDDLLEMLKAISPEHYQYVGPYLHTVPNMPERILNMPGIKETKNKFPTRIADELKDFEGLEYLSPYLYELLMPEVWPSYRPPYEKPTTIMVRVKSQYKPEFFSKLKTDVPMEKYLPDSEYDIPLKSKLRTINITKESLLTLKDAESFAKTLETANDFGFKNNNIIRIYQAGHLIDQWEAEHSRSVPISKFKDMVNPCQRLAQRIKLSGLKLEFEKTISKEGFDLKSWAYTCDKTIKAYRIANMNIGVLQSILSYKSSQYDKYLDMMGDENSQYQYAIMQAFEEMYKAPKADVLEMINDKEQSIRNNLLKVRHSIIDSPIIVN